LQAAVYRHVRRRLVTGQIVPGVALSTRGLARELGVSPMPVREAVSRLAADRALEVRSKSSILVPAMTPARFEDLLLCRLLLEPAAAARALPAIDDERLARLRGIDADMNLAIGTGDVQRYMLGNFQFHFMLYEAEPAPTLIQLIETLWLQFGPFMRVVHGRYGTSRLADQHAVALAAMERGDAAGVKSAVETDIRDGMGLIGRAIFAED
jgi:DNA-binding GntR family transcriptional regulator